MKKLMLTLLVAVGVLATASTARARTMYSPMLFPDGDNELMCSVINSDDSRQITVRIEIVGFGAQVLLETEEFVLYPGVLANISLPASEGAQYCRFELVRGSRRAAQASAGIFQRGAGCISTAPAS